MEPDGTDEIGENGFWPAHIEENPTLVFFCNFVFLPLLLFWLVYAYIKTIFFARNTYQFYQRYQKNHTCGDFDTQGDSKSSKKHEKKQKEEKTSKSDHFKREK
mmetsp:Transcript_40027/g.52409  ORF Transcript_40027/g.52409 Transcript_40027/m.52409 type:complete len:103 (+) Transcript_40027:63-371(+)